MTIMTPEATYVCMAQHRDLCANVRPRPGKMVPRRPRSLAAADTPPFGPYLSAQGTVSHGKLASYASGLGGTSRVKQLGRWSRMD